MRETISGNDVILTGSNGSGNRQVSLSMNLVMRADTERERSETRVRKDSYMMNAEYDAREKIFEANQMKGRAELTLPVCKKSMCVLEVKRSERRRKMCHPSSPQSQDSDCWM